MIEIRELTKRYGDFVAVDGISLSTARGEVFGFLGPNGAGKTTTIRILAGLSTPTSGEVEIGGLDVAREPRRTKAMTGFIPDRPHLYEKLTGNEHLRFVADLYEVDYESRRGWLEQLASHFDIATWLDSRIENYSHGMKQKLVLISSLVHEPSLLIIDEPMVGLDVLAQKLVRELLRSEASRGRTIFLTTHTMSVAEAVCDRIAILHRGKIVARGTPAEIKDRAGRPGNPLEDVFLELTTNPVSEELAS